MRPTHVHLRRVVLLVVGVGLWIALRGPLDGTPPSTCPSASIAIISDWHGGARIHVNLSSPVESLRFHTSNWARVSSGWKLHFEEPDTATFFAHPIDSETTSFDFVVDKTHWTRPVAMSAMHLAMPHPSHEVLCSYLDPVARHLQVFSSATSNAPPASPAWTCIQGLSAPMAIGANGDVACWSDNAHDCAWGATCQSLVLSGAQPKAPLSCGCIHLREWGSTGYNDPSHWCSTVKTTLRATPPNPNCTPAPTVATLNGNPSTSAPLTTPGWKCIQGLSAPMNIDANGDVACWSNNAHDCAWGATCQSLVLSGAQPKAPLSCGCMHLKEW
ncbi:hypothetical protein As57867_021896, partial [Aphanomyces stellatus]